MGCCIAGFDKVAALDAAGADYYELPVATLVMAAGAPGSAAFREAVARTRLKPLAYNVLFPRTLPLVGPLVDRDAVARYFIEAVERIGAGGGRVVVFGSGQSRSVPEGVNRAVALDELERLLRWAAAAAGARGLVIALEPLRRAESNIFNTIRECAGFLRERRLNGIRLLADAYHMQEEGEPLSAIDPVGDLLVHAHVADIARRPPGHGGYDFAAFFRRLRAAGYQGDCAIECAWTDFTGEIADSLARVRQAAADAGWG